MFGKNKNKVAVYIDGNNFSFDMQKNANFSKLLSPSDINKFIKLYEFAERKAINNVLLASEEVKKGEIVRGDTDMILGKLVR